MLSGLGASGQVLLPAPETAFSDQHQFNPELIRQKGIRKITFDIIDKKDFQVAVDKNLTETYEFNDDGRISRYYFTNVVKTIEKQVTVYNRKRRPSVHTRSEFLYDTVSTSYFYRGPNLILKRYHDGGNYYEARYYSYDSLGNLTREQRFRETNNSPDKSIFILGNQVLLSEDSFQYNRYSSGQMKCIYLNSENRPYKERIINFDSLGRKKLQHESYTAASWIVQEQKFDYRNGRLFGARFEGNANNRIILQTTYEYDEKAELYGEKHFKNDLLTKEVSYITDKTNGLLNSFVIRDHVNKSMRIVKLRYDMGMISKAGEPVSSPGN